MLVFFLLSAFAHTQMKAGRGIYDSGDVSVTTARSARSNNRYKKARKWEARCFFSWQENLMVSARFLSLWSPR